MFKPFDNAMLSGAVRGVLRRCGRYLQYPAVSVLKKTRKWEMVEAASIASRTFEYDAPDTWSIGRPVFPDKLAPNYLSRIRRHDIPAPVLAEVPNVRLLAPFGAGYDERHRLIYETTVPSDYRVEKAVSLGTHFRSRRVRPDKELEIACSFLYRWDDNYGHWVYEVLPRAQGVLEWQRRNGTKVPVLVRKDGDPIQRESLRMLGFEESQFVPFDAECILVRNLLISSFRHNALVASPRGLRWLRDTLLQSLGMNPEPTPSDRRRVLVLRPRSVARSMVNDAEVGELLARHGFESFYLERLSFAEKVRLFAQAELVVAPHGAGLSSLVFCKRAAIIELVGRHINHAHFFGLAGSLGHKFGVLVNPDSPFSLYQQRENIRVDLGALERAVARMTVECANGVLAGAKA